LFIKTETRISKREKPKTAVDTKTEKPGILSAKTEKPISKVTKTRRKTKKTQYPPPPYIYAFLLPMGEGQQIPGTSGEVKCCLKLS